MLRELARSYLTIVKDLSAAPSFGALFTTPDAAQNNVGLGSGGPRLVQFAVPGHFELATKSELKRFRDYLNDLYEQVRALKQANETLEQVRHDIHMEKYSDFRQYAKYEATFADNAAAIYHEMQAH